MTKSEKPTELHDEDLDVAGGREAAQFSLMAASFKNAGGNYNNAKSDTAGSMTAAAGQRKKGKVEYSWKVEEGET